MPGSSLRSSIYPFPAGMPFLEPPTEATPAPSLQDPWDWTVDQVVFNLTNPNSPLLISNPSLSLPEYRAFADTLRDNDVTGLALLTEVNTQSLRDELGVRSFGHRASINLLIRQLQEQSREFHEQFQDSSRPSSARLAPRIGSRSPVTWEPQATSRFSELWHSPLTSAGSLQHRFGIDAIAASVQEQAGGQQRNILIEGPELPRHHLPERLSPGVGSEEKKGKDLHINEMKGGHDAGSPEDTNHSTCNGSSGNMASGLHSEDTSVVGEPGCNVRPGETAIIDETGKRRRRLALVLPDRSESERAPGARTWVSEDSGKPPKTVKKRISADVSFESTTVVDTCSPFSPNEDSVELHEHAADLETETSPPNNAVDSLAALAEPGAVLIDEKGRKRMRPTLLTKPEQDIEYHDGLQGHGEELTGATASHNGMLTNADPAAALKKLKHGRRVERSTDEIYLGHEPMAVDDLIYGDTALEKQVVDNEPDQPDDFVLCPDNNASSGQRIYINARIKYFLNSAILSLEREGHDYIGILPYPSRIGKKHHPLSITLFSKSAGGITASRSNRSKWIKDNSQQDPSTSDEKMSNVFNVVDPALAHDESEDPDWKALEKWKYLEGKDDVLPVYGDSDSEGEYDLETWREMEDEQGKILRSEGRCKSQKLTIEEVEVAIDDALAQIIKEWTLKEWPRLQLRAWRLWAKSRRNGNANAQVSLFTQEIGSLINRIAELREEISAEDWSKTSELRKQCKILQPSIFDLQDRKWKIATLKLREAPEKPPPTARRLRVTMPEVPDQELKEGEENIDTDAEIWESSHDSLDDFVVDDEANAGDILERTLNDDNVTMADGEDTMDSDTMVAAGDDLLVTPKCEKEAVLAKLDLGSSIFDRKPAAKQSPSIIIDLTQQSDPIEPKTPPPKPNRSFAIRTPPIYDSEDDSEIFERIQRSRSIKPVFRVPSIASPTVTVIDLESDSCDAMATPGSPIRTVLPDLKDFEGIKSMDTSRLEERQDRKRVLIWMIAHALGWRRNAAYCYLKNISIEASRMIVREGLTRLLGNHQVLKNMNNGDSDSVMQIATWQVCWTIPVIVKPDRGLSISHIKTTLDDEDCYDEFYDFLLECLRHYEKPSGSTSLITPRKKRQLIQPEDSSSELGHSALRKRKYFVPESQETLEKRQAARQRVADDDERRRREELKSRLSTMGSKEKDPLEVIVNPGKREDEEFIHLNPAFGNGAHMKPHQKEGLQFMWREITGDHQNLQGCLLAHAQGLGKTMQVRTFQSPRPQGSKCFGP